MDHGLGAVYSPQSPAHPFPCCGTWPGRVNLKSAAQELPSLLQRVSGMVEGETMCNGSPSFFGCDCRTLANPLCNADPTAHRVPPMRRLEGLRYYRKSSRRTLIMKFKRLISSVFIALLATSSFTAVHADEGMWTFNNVPRAEIKKKYGFDVTDAWLKKVQLASVRFN